MRGGRVPDAATAADGLLNDLYYLRGAGRPVDGPPHSWWQRDQDDLAACYGR